MERCDWFILRCMVRMKNFIVRTLSRVHGGKQIRVTDKSFKSDFRAAFGDLIEDAWFASEIHVARLIRHSLMHAGGRVTDDLRKCKIPVVVQDEGLNIFPEHILNLYQVLKTPALAIMTSDKVVGKE